MWRLWLPYFAQMSYKSFEVEIVAEETAVEVDRGRGQRRDGALRRIGDQAAIHGDLTTGHVQDASNCRGDHAGGNVVFRIAGNKSSSRILHMHFQFLDRNSVPTFVWYAIVNGYIHLVCANAAGTRWNGKLHPQKLLLGINVSHDQ